MAFVVKYIGNCAKNSVDIRPLLTEDLQTGNKILLVCEKQYGARYYGDDITVIDSVQDVQGAKTSVMLLLSSSNSSSFDSLCNVSSFLLFIQSPPYHNGRLISYCQNSYPFYTICIGYFL